MKWLAIVLCVVSALCCAAMNIVEFAYLHPINGGLKSPDIRILGYTSEQFIAWQNASGNAGIDMYLKWVPNGVDMFFPALFGVTLALLFHLALKQFPRYVATNALLKIIVPTIFVLPYVFFDYFENSVIVDLLQKDALYGEGTAEFASVLTVLKFSSLSIAVLCIAVLGYVGRVLKRKAA